MSSSVLHAFAFGIATKNSQGDVIEVYYPEPLINPDSDYADAVLNVIEFNEYNNGFAELNSEIVAQLAGALEVLGFTSQSQLVEQLSAGSLTVIACALFTDSKPASVPEAYLKLHLLSHRHAKPHELNLDGIFGVLPNLAWTNQGAISLNDLPARQLAARLEGQVLEVMSIDKFPKMTNYVVPSGVRIAHTARVRLGAYLGEGTTIMHEGFVNFNAGTDGPAMIEGRISAGVMVGENSDLGGGCSTMGTLSGGGTEVISVGKNCLIGANAGIGFPLADGCIVEAGLYVTAGTKVNVLTSSGTLEGSVKARELSATPDRLFRRNSLSGAVECVPLKSAVTLNEELHSHN
jgi:2,3,4,5-tetrahydropyridine-2,6-dicarboxylate N-succinyltransferase